MMREATAPTDFVEPSIVHLSIIYCSISWENSIIVRAFSTLAFGRGPQLHKLNVNPRIKTDGNFRKKYRSSRTET
jgi:hypothetical protein